MSLQGEIKPCKDIFFPRQIFLNVPRQLNYASGVTERVAVITLGRDWRFKNKITLYVPR
ncbi:hypothetical protein Dthio_PD1961 [Desulfonatronospira thiodismutans ASO3-1]|uniref:Uncharacterized protein n=1 Tax=Desulfonatronospira thiodismutans ASO3-1 TaxID=555779 RepID=D6SPB3_9BACT|nr:hypothetical protein Dthio_PD1961 [Desulfonatronospira thiodismutans ASO3-1]